MSRHGPAGPREGKVRDGSDAPATDAGAREMHGHDLEAIAFDEELAHELRSALAGISANLELALEPRFGALNTDQRECLSAVEVGLRRLEELVEDVALTAAIERGRVELHPSRLDVAALLSLALAEFRPRCEARDLQLTLCVQPGVPWALADRTSVRRIVQNLLSNALSYTPAGGRIDVSLLWEAEAERVLLTVADTGIGLADADVSRIGTPFYRAEAARGIRPSGTGLGLFIATGLAELNGGRLSFEAPREPGTRAKLLLRPAPDGQT